MNRKHNTYVSYPDYIEVYTAANELFVISPDDLESVKQFYWHIDSKGYVCTNNRIVGHIRLHRYLMNPGELQVDHINRNKLDNRRENLRIVTNQRNHFNRPINKNNSSGCTGVYFHGQAKKWGVYITVSGKTITGGLFTDKQAAIAKRKSLESIYFNEERN